MSAEDNKTPTTVTPTAVEAAAVAGWSTEEGATAKLTLMPGGATGRTFKLEAESGESSPPPVIVRALLPTSDDRQYARVSEILAKASVAPPVVGSTETLVVSEFVSGKPSDATTFDGNEAALKSAARLAAKLHTVDVETIRAVRPARENELLLWHKWARKSIPSLPDDVFDVLNVEINSCNSLRKLKGAAGSVVVGHGDLHPGNILIGDLDEAGNGDAWLVDLEHVCPRVAAEDIAYLFAVWGDLRYMAGWTPSADEPTPYAPFDRRKAFAEQYLGTRSGETPSEETVVEFLYEVERAGVAQRLRLMFIWILIARGDPNHMLVGAVSAFIPHVRSALTILKAAEEGDSSVKDDVVKRGVIAYAAAKAATAAATAAAAISPAQPQEVN